MTVFILLSAALAAVALLFVLPPLLGRGARRRAHTARRDQAEVAIAVLREQLAELKIEHAAGKLGDESFERSRAEIEQRVLEEGRVVEDGADLRPSRAWALAMALLVPLAAVLVYSAVGEPQALDPNTHVAQANPGDITPEQFSKMVEQLAERLEDDPADENAWMMLARSYLMLGNYEVAAATWSRIGEEVPENASVLTEWAEVLVGSQEGDFDGEPRRLIERALELEPDHFKALALAGAAAFESGDHVQAAARWEQILEQISPQDPSYASVLASVNEARSQGGLPPLATAAGAESGAASGLEQLRGTIRLSAQLAEQELPEQATVFIFVRAPEGGMPFAALRFPATELPREFDFAEAQRMNEAPLPSEVVVGARVSMSGDAAPQSGDLETLPLRIQPGTDLAELLIDRIRE